MELRWQRYQQQVTGTGSGQYRTPNSTALLLLLLLLCGHYLLLLLLLLLSGQVVSVPICFAAAQLSRLSKPGLANQHQQQQQ
jgi:hypothetical protein